MPASIEAATGVIISTINVPLQTGLATARVFLNVGTAVLTLNPATVLIYRPHDGVYSGVAACLGGS